MLGERERLFLAKQRVGRLATADRAGKPHVVPVCFAVNGHTLYITIDAKPKRGTGLKRLRNLAENPEAAVIIDHYDEDWSRLGWVMVSGKVEILADGPEHDAAQAALRARYPQYATMALAPLPVIALRIAQVRSWGALGSP